LRVGFRSSSGGRSTPIAASAIAVALLLSASGAAARTRPDVAIVNSAQAAFSLGGAASSAASNAATLVTLETLDIALARTGSDPIVLRPSVVTPIPFTLTNAGNGSEAFTLAGTIAGIGATITGYAIDRNGDGKYDPAVDTAIAIGANTPPLDSGASLALLVLVESDAPANGGTLTLSSHAVTGSGAPGTIFAGKGDGGVDAIVGTTTAAATLSIPLTAGTDATAVVLDKSQAILAFDGSASAVSGAIVTYTIAAHFSGSGLAKGGVLSDPIPDGTAYVPGSLRLDGAVLTDASDADAGSADAAGISVALGDVAAPALRTISFQVTIK